MSSSYLKSPTSSSTSSFSSQEHIPLNPPTLSSTSTSSTLSIFCVARFIEQFTLEDPSTREKEAGWWCCWRLLLIFCCVYCPQKIVFVFCKRVVGVVNDLLVLLKNANDRSYVESDLIFSFSFIFFSTNVLLGLIFLHMKARKLWQKFRDITAWITDLTTKQHKLQ